MTNTAHWTDCIRAFLHDPPDKALDIKLHEDRACRYLGAALDIPPESAREGVKSADWLASAIERLPLPRGTLRDCDGNQLDPILEQPFNRILKNELERCSPFSGDDLTNVTTALRQAQDLSAEIITKREDVIRSIAQANPDNRLRAYALWRLLPEALPHVSQLPGDTRLKDHSITDHADASMAACASLREGNSASLLVFSLGPVQDFIVKGRSLRDLWTGSYLLSWLTFQSMIPLLEQLGPWCITSPGLRKNPLCDWWLGKQGVMRPGTADRKASPLAAEKDSLRWAGLPNTFTALVPTSIAADLQTKVIDAQRAAWKGICLSVQQGLGITKDNPNYRYWESQCNEVWDVRCLSLPFLTINKNEDIPAHTLQLRKQAQDLLGELPESVIKAGQIAELLKPIAPKYVHKDSQGLWTLANLLAQKLLETDKRVRKIPFHADEKDTNEKCVLFPGFSVMGPQGDTSENKKWWKNTPPTVESSKARIRAEERLSAPGLVKRFAYDCFFKHLIGKLPFPDTREAAMQWWIAEAERLDPKAWKKFKNAVAKANEDAQDTDPWTAAELLDPSRQNQSFWSEWTEGEYREFVKKRNDFVKVAKEKCLLPEPKPYYAVLCADGDEMGKYLRGEKGPKFNQAYHSKMLIKLKEMKVSEDILQTVRPQGMAAQLAFSAALNEFTSKAGTVIDKHHGTCVYAGGDDVLAIVPVATCLNAAAELASLFRQEVSGATLSVGIAIVHASDDLRVAITQAREAETQAKRSGRDGCCLRIIRRSGDTTSAFCPWLYRPEDQGKHAHTRSLPEDWQTIAQALAGQSDRWVHHLLSERDALRSLGNLPPVWLRVKHHLLHGEEGKKIETSIKAQTGEGLPVLLDLMQEIWADSKIGMQKPEGIYQRLEAEKPGDGKAWLVDQFLTWCEHAAWISKFLKKPNQESAQ